MVGVGAHGVALAPLAVSLYKVGHGIVAAAATLVSTLMQDLRHRGILRNLALQFVTAELGLIKIIVKAPQTNWQVQLV
jgi:hypothetical protein